MTLPKTADVAYVLRAMWPKVRPQLRDDERMTVQTDGLIASDFDGWRIRADYFRVDRHENMIRPSYRHAVVNVLASELTSLPGDWRRCVVDVLKLALQKLAVLLTPIARPPAGWRLYGRRATR